MRALEEEGIRSRASEVYLSVPNAIALYILNNKRDRLMDIERRYGFRVFVRADDSLCPTGFNLEAIKAEVETSDHDDDSDDQDEAMQQPSKRHQSDDRSGGRNQNRRGGRNQNRGDRGQRSSSQDDHHDAEGEAQHHEQSVADHGAEASEPAQAQQTPATQPQSSSGGFKAKRFSSRKAANPDTASTPTQPQTANDSAPPTSEESEAGDGSRKKGWWNRLID